MLSNQFKKQYVELNNKGLSLPEKAYMTEIYDRMESSKRNPDFYDKTIHDYYVIFTNEEMAKTLEVGLSTVKRTIKKLIEKGWIHIKRLKNRVNCIFICDDKKISSEKNTKLNNEVKMNSVIGSKWTANQTKNKQTKNNIDTYMSQNECIYKSSPSSTSLSFDTDIEYQLRALKTTLHNKVNIPLEAINILYKQLDNDLNKIQAFISNVFIAKSIACRKTKKQLRFENNGVFQGTFANTIFKILSKAKTVAKKPTAYIKISLLNYFEELIEPKKVAKPKTFVNKNRIVEKLPSWAINNCEKAQEPSPQDKEKTLKDIELLKKKLNIN